MDMALGDFNTAINLDPKNYRTYCNRGSTYAEMGEAGKAILDYSRVIELVPDESVGYNLLAWLYATWPAAEVRDGPKALELATKACTLSEWKRAYCIGTLAAAEAETGNFDEAIKHAKQALAMARTDETIDSKMRSVMADALAVYQQKRPYRDLKK